MALTISAQQRQQFTQEGYFILERAIGDAELALAGALWGRRRRGRDRGGRRGRRAPRHLTQGIRRAAAAAPDRATSGTPTPSQAAPASSRRGNGASRSRASRRRSR